MGVDFRERRKKGNLQWTDTHGTNTTELIGFPIQYNTSLHIVAVCGITGFGYANNYNIDGKFNVVRAGGDSWMTYRCLGLGW